MITVTINTNGITYADSISRRTTCDRCGLRRVCAPTWIGVRMTYCDRTTATKLDAGDLCYECREKLRLEVTP